MYEDALIIEPMKINHIPKGKEHMLPSLCESGEYFCQLKKDGYWYMFERTENNYYLFSRNKSVTTGTLSEKSANVPHIMDVLKHLEPGTILIGEIYYPGKRSEDVTPIMGSLPEKAIERQEGEYGYLHYYIHDMIYYKGRSLLDVGAGVRYRLLKKVYDKLLPEGHEYVELAHSATENLEDVIQLAFAMGEEGVVLKKRTAPYTPGKRPVWDTIKIKQTATCDAICLGFDDPTMEYAGKLDLGPNYTGPDAGLWPYWCMCRKDLATEQIIYEHKVPIGQRDIAKGIDWSTIPVTKAYYYGWKTSMNVGAYDDNGNIVSIGSVSSGLTEKIQEIAGANPEIYIGQVVELSGMQKNNDVHTLRHFFFKRFRDDKNPEECTIKNIFS
jgi:ATP-dependent DNA ligase